MQEENKKSYLSEAQEQVESYIQDRLLLIKLQATEKSAKLIGILAAVFLIALVSFFVVFFVSIMAGFIISAKTGSFYIGFGIVTGIYIILLIILVTRKKQLEKLVADTIVKILFDKTDLENDED